jgi:hypothetical protein
VPNNHSSAGQAGSGCQVNAEGRLVSFTVMVRPMRGLQKLVELMAYELTAGQA